MFQEKMSDLLNDSLLGLDTLSDASTSAREVHSDVEEPVKNSARRRESNAPSSARKNTSSLEAHWSTEKKARDLGFRTVCCVFLS